MTLDILRTFLGHINNLLEAGVQEAAIQASSLDNAPEKRMLG